MDESRLKMQYSGKELVASNARVNVSGSHEQEANPNASSSASQAMASERKDEQYNTEHVAGSEKFQEEYA